MKTPKEREREKRYCIFNEMKAASKKTTLPSSRNKTRLQYDLEKCTLEISEKKHVNMSKIILDTEPSYFEYQENESSEEPEYFAGRYR